MATNGTRAPSTPELTTRTRTHRPRTRTPHRRAATHPTGATEGTMTEQKVKWSKDQVRAVAWVAGTATLFTGIAVVGALPKGASTPLTKANAGTKSKTQVRKVYVITGAGGGAPVAYSTGGGSSGTWKASGGNGGGNRGGGNGGGTHSPWPSQSPSPSPLPSPSPSPSPSPGHSPHPSTSPTPSHSPVCTTSPSGVTTCV